LHKIAAIFGNHQNINGKYYSIFLIPSNTHKISKNAILLNNRIQSFIYKTVSLVKNRNNQGFICSGFRIRNKITGGF